MSKEIRTITNSRGERASTDGRDWWLGEADADETTRKANALQPIGTLFPVDTAQEEEARRLRSVFISCLRKAAPHIQPESDAERAAFRKAWDDACGFGGKRPVKRAGVPVFDGKLQLVGTADAVFAGGDGADATYCYFQGGYPYAGAMNALVRMLWQGLPFGTNDDPCGCYTQRDLSCALLAVVHRHETDWWREYARDMPF